MKNSNDRLKAKIKDSYSKIAVDNSKTERMLGDIMAAVKDKKEKKKSVFFIGVVCVQMAAIVILLTIVIKNGTKLGDEPQTTRRVAAKFDTVNESNDKETDSKNTSTTENITSDEVTKNTNTNNNDIPQDIIKNIIEETVYNNNFLWLYRNEVSAEKGTNLTNADKLWYILNLVGNGEKIDIFSETEISGELIRNYFQKSCISSSGLELTDIGYYGSSDIIYNYDKKSDTFIYNEDFKARGVSLAVPAYYKLDSLRQSDNQYVADITILYVGDMVSDFENEWAKCRLYFTYNNALEDRNGINMYGTFKDSGYPQNQEAYFDYIANKGMSENMNVTTHKLVFRVSDGGNIVVSEFYSVTQ